MSDIFSHVGKFGKLRAFSVPIFVMLFIITILIHPALATTFNNPLVDAADLGDRGQVAKLLKAGNLPDSKGDFGTTAIMRAAFRGNTDIIQLLMESGAYINAADIGGETALHLAAKNGHADAVKALLYYGAYIDIPDKEKWTPLMRATLSKNTEVAKILIEKGADVSTVNNFNESALVHASIANVPAIAALITGSKKAKAIGSEQENMAISYAKRKSHPKMEKLLNDFAEDNNNTSSIAEKSVPKNNDVIPEDPDTIQEKSKKKYDLLGNSRPEVVAVEPKQEKEPVDAAQTDKATAKTEEKKLEIADSLTKIEAKSAEVEKAAPSSYRLIESNKTPWKTEISKPATLEPSAETITIVAEKPALKNENPLTATQLVKEEKAPLIALTPPKQQEKSIKSEPAKNGLLSQDLITAIDNDSATAVITENNINAKNAATENTVKNNEKLPVLATPVTVYGPPMPTDTEKTTQATLDGLAKETVKTPEQAVKTENTANKPVEEPGASKNTTAKSENVFYVQLGNFNSDHNAELAWNKISATSNDILVKLKPNIVHAILSSAPGDSVYRLRAGTLATKSDADDICKKLRALKIDCNVVEIANIPFDYSSKAIAPVNADTATDAATSPVKAPTPIASGTPEAAPLPSPSYPKLAATEKPPLPLNTTITDNAIASSEKTPEAPINANNPTILPWHSGSAPVRTQWLLPAGTIITEPVSELAPITPVSTSAVIPPAASAPSATVMVPTPIVKENIPPLAVAATPTIPQKQTASSANSADSLNKKQLESQNSSQYFRMSKPATVSQPSQPTISNLPYVSQTPPPQPIDLTNNADFIKNKENIRSEMQGMKMTNFPPKQAIKTQERPKKEYDDFYKQLKNGEKEVPVSEAIMVPDETYFLHKNQLNNVENTTKVFLPQESGTWLNITNLPDESFANDYGMRMFKYDESLGNVQIHVIKPAIANTSGPVSMRVGPVIPTQAEALCNTVKAGGYSCSVSGHTGNSTSASVSQSKYSSPSSTLSDVYWINLGTFTSTSEAEYYWMFIKDDNADILNSLQYNMPKAPEHAEFGREAVQLRAGPFTMKQRASQLCNIMRYRNIACLVTE